MTVTPMLPMWPKCRCDRCHTVYTMPPSKREGLVTGDCPKCGYDRFSTRIDAEALAGDGE